MNPAFDSFSELVRKRRATQHFTSEEVPERDISLALELAGHAPSGYNFQPWRFLVIREKERKEALKRAAFGQPKIGEAPVVVVAYGQREGWKEYADLTMTEATRNRGIESKKEEIKKTALNFLGQVPGNVWINRQVMIGFTHLMLAFEALGWDTAPMEGFDGAAVLEAMSLPEDSEIVALLAVGRGAQEPAFPGRLPVGKIAFREEHTRPWMA